MKLKFGSKFISDSYNSKSKVSSLLNLMLYVYLTEEFYKTNFVHIDITHVRLILIV